jgi:hypothetical protein
MFQNIADWFIGGLYLAFILGVIMYTYFEIRNRLKK